MRKITAQAKRAWDEHRHFKKDNTEVTDDCLRLHRNEIAQRLRNGNGKLTGEIRFSMCGWDTVTTRERLQVIGLSIRQRSFNQEVWDSKKQEWITISTYCTYILDQDGGIREL
jgi:hypothetical protein